VRARSIVLCADPPTGEGDVTSAGSSWLGMGCDDPWPAPDTDMHAASTDADAVPANTARKLRREKDPCTAIMFPFQFLTAPAVQPEMTHL
jgi:hypothetical protein